MKQKKTVGSSVSNKRPVGRAGKGGLRKEGENTAFLGQPGGLHRSLQTIKKNPTVKE